MGRWWDGRAAFLLLPFESTLLLQVQLRKVALVLLHRLMELPLRPTQLPLSVLEQLLKFCGVQRHCRVHSFLLLGRERRPQRLRLYSLLLHLPFAPPHAK